MSKLNRGATTMTRSPLRTEATPSGVTFEGAPGYARDAKSELFLLAVANMVGEATFYETGPGRDNRFANLCRQVAVEDGDWLLRFTGWLRNTANMRSASIVLAAQAVHARLAAGMTDNRPFIAAAISRADEPGELVAYWLATFGRAIPKPVKRALVDACQRLYTERNLLKWDSEAATVRFGDVIVLAHAPGRGDWQRDLFRLAIDVRHKHAGPVPESLPTLRARAVLADMPVPARRELLSVDNAWSVLDAAGFTWEALAGWLQGPMDKVAWQAVIPSMGYMALLRNLRNFEAAKLDESVLSYVADRLADPEQVARSRQLPMRFLSAYNAVVGTRFVHPIEMALQHCLASIPELPGRTLILVDRSGSMWTALSARSDLTRADAAAVFGAALALRSADPTLIVYGSSAHQLAVPAGAAILPLVKGMPGQLGGTYTGAAVQATFQAHDRVIIVTDEQWHDQVTLPDKVPMYVWNLAGYRLGGMTVQGKHYTFGGLSDAAFGMIPLLEKGDWPF